MGSVLLVRGVFQGNIEMRIQGTVRTVRGTAIPVLQAPAVSLAKQATTKQGK
jgi:hypothetical protein